MGRKAKGERIKVDHLSMDVPVSTSGSSILGGDIIIDGPCIYSIHDSEGRCAYVGRTKNIRTRLSSHRGGHGKKINGLKEVFESCDPLVHVYGPLATDRLIIDSDDHGPFYDKLVVNDPSYVGQEWFVQGEIVHCQILKPYLNKKLTYRFGMEFLLSAGMGELYVKTVYQNLKTFGVREPAFSEEVEYSFDRAGIFDGDAKKRILIECERNNT